MTDAEKFKIAQDNQTLRNQYQHDLAPYQRHIIYIGTNTPLGIPGNGYYDSNNDEHRLAVMSVGGTLSKEAKALKQKIDEKNKPPTLQNENIPNENIPPPSELIVKYKGYRFVLYIWHYTQQKDQIINYHNVGVMHQPSWQKKDISTSGK